MVIMRSKPKNSTDADWLITLLESLFRAKSLREAGS